eukprot:g29899.t1
MRQYRSEEDLVVQILTASINRIPLLRRLGSGLETATKLRMLRVSNRADDGLDWKEARSRTARTASMAQRLRSAAWNDSQDPLRKHEMLDWPASEKTGPWAGVANKTASVLEDLAVQMLCVSQAEHGLHCAAREYSGEEEGGRRGRGGRGRGREGEDQRR